MGNAIIDAVGSMKPGQRLDIAMGELEHHIRGFEYNGVFFSPADRVLENIVGSAYEYSYWIDERRRVVIFERLSKPLEEPSCYVSPDRR